MTTTQRPALLNGWRIAGWGSLAALLALPALAMRFTGEVDWTASDFVFAALLLGFLGICVELAVRFAKGRAMLLGYLIAGLTAFLTFWSNAAVGIIGDENASVNVGFFAFVVIGFAAAALRRFRAPAMRRIATELAIGQYALGVIALFAMPGHAVEWGFLTVFAMFWLAAAWCFHRAAQTVHA